MDMKDGAIWRWLSYLALLLLGALALFLFRQGLPEANETVALANHEVTVVIDPGHGGEDGGAVSADGVAESGINLEVARRLDAVLTLCGQRTLLLRDEDISLHDEGVTTIREKKVSDIHNRVKLVNAQQAPRLISIHQNHFSSAKYHGAQVFYGGGPLGQPWAEQTQTTLREALEPDNHREAKPIGHDVYLMNHITCPAILVECGFLSNREECQKLTDPAYQTKLALAIGGAYLQSVAAELIPE